MDENDWWRAQEGSGEEEIAFCRLEHVVPWAMKGPGWSAVALVHHRGGHQISESFGSVEEMRAWAAAGGPWQGGQ